MNARNLIAKVVICAWMIFAAGCFSGGPGKFTPTTPSNQPANHTVGGSVFGLLGTLVLEINGGDALTLTADGVFTFSNALPLGRSYTVTVQSQPATQICTVSNGSGAIANADVTSVTVNCSALTRSVGGSVSGLDISASVILQNNGGDDLAITGNGGFTFTTPVAQSALYNVTVLTQPATQTCTVANSSGAAGSTNITDVQVTCSTNAYTVGGVISGLSGSVVLQNNGADNFSVNSDGVFKFLTPVAQGASYNVTVLTQPPAQTCTVTNGSGSIAGANVTNVGVSCVANTTTLTTSVSDLALSVTGLTEYGVSGTPSSGTARIITITNTGSYAAFNLSVTSPTWPAGTTSSTTCGSLLAASSSCTITITPGNTATSDGTNACSIGTAPIPGSVQISADNASTVSSNVVIVSYGCIYQGGYVYALDDTTTDTGSVGGKVVATADQTASVIWSSNSVGSVAFNAIYGVSETSTTSSPDPSSGQVSGQTACNGSTDGACDTNNIYVYYQNNAAGAPINLSYYAAGLCKQTISGYADWSLPAICELGFGGTACGTSGTPTLQNMQSSLVEFNGLNLLGGWYWSSTEFSGSPSGIAWSQLFASSGGSAQSFNNKGSLLGVRCSRSLSP